MRSWVTFADVRRCGPLVAIEEIEWADQGIPEAVGDAPGVTAFADDDALDAEIERRLADALGHLVHLFVC